MLARLTKLAASNKAYLSNLTTPLNVSQSENYVNFNWKIIDEVCWFVEVAEKRRSNMCNVSDIRGGRKGNKVGNLSIELQRHIGYNYKVMYVPDRTYTLEC